MLFNNVYNCNINFIEHKHKYSLLKLHSLTRN